MPITTTLLRSSYPRFGWSSWWGAQGSIQPGCMGIAYQLKTTGATGEAAVLNDGLTCDYKNRPQTVQVYNSAHSMFLSEVPIGIFFDQWTPLANTVRITVTFYIVLPPGPAWIWIQTVPRPIPRATIALGIPPVGPAIYPATVPNPLTAQPINGTLRRELP